MKLPVDVALVVAGDVNVVDGFILFTIVNYSIKHFKPVDGDVNGEDDDVPLQCVTITSICNWMDKYCKNIHIYIHTYIYIIIIHIGQLPLHKIYLE